MDNSAGKPEPVTPTIDEIVDNTIASMALEGYILTAEEKDRVRANAHKGLAERLAKAKPPAPAAS